MNAITDPTTIVAASADDGGQDLPPAGDRPWFRAPPPVRPCDVPPARGWASVSLPATVFENQQPKPLVPPQAKLPTKYMPLMDSVWDSDFRYSTDAAEFRAGLRLWAAAWQQHPPASLPANPRVIAGLAGFGEATPARWAKIQGKVLQGWVLCTENGRLYHPFLAVVANDVLGDKSGRVDVATSNANPAGESTGERARRVYGETRQGRQKAVLTEFGVTRVSDLPADLLPVYRARLAESRQRPAAIVPGGVPQSVPATVPETVPQPSLVTVPDTSLSPVPLKGNINHNIASQGAGTGTGTVSHPPSTATGDAQPSRPAELIHDDDVEALQTWFAVKRKGLWPGEVKMLLAGDRQRIQQFLALPGADRARVEQALDAAMTALAGKGKAAPASVAMFKDDVSAYLALPATPPPPPPPPAYVDAEPEGTTWRRVRDRLRAQIGDAEFVHWIAPLALERMEVGEAVLSAPTSFIRDRVHNHLRDVLLRAWRAVVPGVETVTIIMRKAS